MNVAPATSGSAPQTTKAGPWRARVVGLVALIVLLVVHFLDTPLRNWMRLELFDAYQYLAPRTPASFPGLVVAIDEPSLTRFGQWPWPRKLLARLIDRIAAGDPAAIGIDIIMPEPDRLSPEVLAKAAADFDPDLARRLAALPSHDAVLARSLVERPVVAGFAGIARDELRAPSRPPTAPAFVAHGGDPLDFVKRYEHSLQSVTAIDRAARGHGLLNFEPEGGAVRRVPLIAAVGATLVPGLGLEMLRVASGEAGFRIEMSRRGVETVALGDVVVPTTPDGRMWVHFSPSDPRRLVSAVDVLEAKADPTAFQGKLVIVGVTALGLTDRPATPLRTRMAGSEVHIQALENIFDQVVLRRPAWAGWAEGTLLALGGLAIVLAVPTTRPRRSAITTAVLLAVLPVTGFALYQSAHVLIDAASPTLSLVALYAAVMAATLTESDRQRRRLDRELTASRDAAAKLLGEMEAARSVQTGLLPRPREVLRNERRADIDAWMQPAHQVGGDLYDFFMIDADRLFFAVGDVSGKGLNAGLFMAVSKALTKSAALRNANSVSDIVSEANAEVARDNPELMFVTLFAGLLDLRSGALETCNAGHEPPFALAPGGAGPVKLPADGGPPLCVLEGFSYASGAYAMTAGATLCLFSDGVTEALNPHGELFGRNRLESLLRGLDTGMPVAQLGDAIRAELSRFVSIAEAADDITVLLLRWNGA